MMLPEECITFNNGIISVYHLRTVNFETNCEQKIESRQYFPYQTITLPPAPQKEDCDFIDWYMDKDFMHPFADGLYWTDYCADNTLTLYAKWAPDKPIILDKNVTFSENSINVTATIKNNGETSTHSKILVSVTSDNKLVGIKVLSFYFYKGDEYNLDVNLNVVPKDNYNINVMLIKNMKTLSQVKR